MLSVGSLVPHEQKLFSCLNTDSNCFGEFHTLYNPSINRILSAKKTVVTRLNGHGPLCPMDLFQSYYNNILNQKNLSV